jgi:rubrerythrin
MKMFDAASFLAHALAFETEAAERYEELADAMTAHNNAEVGQLFHRMAGFSRLHADAVRGRAAGTALPHFKPWDFQWQEPEGPEVAPVERTHYLMTPYHCLQLALHNEKRGRDFYRDVAAANADPEVKRLAEQMAEEEHEHVLVLEDWLSRTPQPDPDWDQDLDPPTVAD